MKSDEVEVHAGFETMDDDDVNNNTNNNDNNNKNTEDLSEMNYEWLHDSIDDPNLFYDDFPPLPDFPCISSPPSSSSSTSSTSKKPQKQNPITTTAACSSSSSASSSSSSSCAVLKKHMQKTITIVEAETEAAAPLCSTASMDTPLLFPNNGGVGDCMDMIDMEMEPFGFIDMLEEQNNADFFHPDSIFQHNNNNLLQTENANEIEIPSFQQQQQEEPAVEAEEEGVTNNNNNREEGEMVIQHNHDDEMSNVFLEWLRSNKDKISASDLRSVKLKKSTIESAAKRLGGGKQGMKSLLKLILEWVQTSHLNNKNPPPIGFGFEPQSSSNPNFFNKPQLSQPPPPPPPPQPCIYASQPSSMVQYLPQPAENNAWPNSQLNVASHYNQPFGDNHFRPAVLYGNQYPYQLLYGNGSGGGDHGWRRLGPLATKEARKKRMARQRKCSSSHQRQSNHSAQPQNQSQAADQVAGAENCSPGNWMYWQGAAGGAASMAPGAPAEVQPAALGQNYCHQGRGSSDKRSQGWKSSEKNLKFLLQKVLKQSDVGSLGRIVLPKKEAETHLPELDARDGISIDMEDIGTSHVWNMRYRYWPNNKSRMYLLENTGDFVRANGLQEGDFIVIYSDVKCGKFMIRGVKVRQAGTPSETKKAAGKTQKNQRTAVNVNGPHNNATSSSPHQLIKMEKN